MESALVNASSYATIYSAEFISVFRSAIRFFCVVSQCFLASTNLAIIGRSSHTGIVTKFVIFKSRGAFPPLRSAPSVASNTFLVLRKVSSPNSPLPESLKNASVFALMVPIGILTTRMPITSPSLKSFLGLSSWALWHDTQASAPATSAVA